jgi:excisionase family DNA binding protein
MAIDVLTARELGEILGLPESRVLLLAKQGQIPSFRIDGRIRFDANDIEGWIERLKDHGARPRLVGT